MTTTDRVAALMLRTDSAFSFDNYGVTGWRSCVRMLIKRGFNDREIEAILRSKWTRWASDMSGKRYGRNTGADLARYLDDPHAKCTPATIAELVVGTFGSLEEN